MAIEIDELARRLEAAIIRLEYNNQRTLKNSQDIDEIKKSLTPINRFVDDCSRGRKFLIWFIGALGVFITIGINIWNSFFSKS